MYILKKIIIISIILITFVSVCFADWVPEIIVTAEDTGNMDHVPEIVVDGSNVPFVFWYGLTGGSIDYYYSRFISGAFEPESILNYSPNQVGSPFGASVDSAGNPCVVWPYISGPTNATMISKWNGSTFIIDTILNYCPGNDPDVACGGDGYIWTAFGYGYDIGFSRWNCISWSPLGLINTPDALSDFDVSIAISPANYPWAVWREDIIDSNSDTTSEISYTKWNGSGWDIESYISTPDTNLDCKPQIAFSSNGVPWVVWYKFLKKDYQWGEIYYSKWEGTNWSNPQVVNTPDTLQEKYPSIAFDENDLPWVVWCGDNESGVYNIYLAKYNGTSFDMEEEIVTSSSRDYWPEIAFDTLGNAWIVYRRGTDDIYCRIYDKTLPFVEVIYPNGGENYSPDDTCEINWIANDNIGIDSISILYSIDNGNTWLPVSSGEPNDSIYEWIIPSTYSDSCFVKIVAYDKGFNQNEDISDSCFSIKPTGVAVNHKFISCVPYLEITPNPFIGKTIIKYSLGSYNPNLNTPHSLQICDISGRIIRSFSRSKVSSDNSQHSIIWDGTDDSDRKVPPGIYFIHFNSKDFKKIDKAIMLR